MGYTEAKLANTAASSANNVARLSIFQLTLSDLSQAKLANILATLANNLATEHCTWATTESM
jgi:hypothetical protein